MYPLSEAARRVCADMALGTGEAAELRAFLAAAERTAEDLGARFDEGRAMALAAHSAGFVRRLRGASPLPAVSASFFDEIDDDVRGAVTALLGDHTRGSGRAGAGDDEVLLFAIHFQIAKSSTWR
ncbi:hypothetical protein ACFOVU_28570 [Nocardiopsis sediminis]|uniref:PRD domain-containing protein n=1 Tax=Nocardiopsis sediminis TaxID=1778267 RepID=A0ABV8FZ39_9ACTN